MSERDRDAGSAKQTVLRAVAELPENVTLDEILERILLQAKIERGRQQLASGRGLSADQVRDRLARWLG